MRFESIEGLRAPLAWWVVVAHLLQVSRVGRESLPVGLEWLHSGIIPVYGFIIVSGLVIANLIDYKQENYLPYLVRRYFRLAPLMIVVMVLAFVLSRFGLWRDWPDDNVAFRIFMQTILMHGVIPDSQLSQGAMTFVNPAWSISLEMQFYMVAPVIMLALRKGGVWLVPIFLALLVSWASTAGMEQKRFVLLGINEQFSKPSHLLSSLHLFLIGILIFLTVKHLRLPKEAERYGLLTIAILCFFWMGSDRILRWMVLPLAGLTAHVVLFPDGRLTRVFEWKPLTYLGKISYSTYLLHFFIVYLARDYFVSGVGNGWELFWLMTAVTIPATLIVSVLSYHFIEQPFARLGSRLAKRLTP